MRQMLPKVILALGNIFARFFRRIFPLVTPSADGIFISKMGLPASFIISPSLHNHTCVLSVFTPADGAAEPRYHSGNLFFPPGDFYLRWLSNPD
jgi:hypothetical protein